MAFVEVDEPFAKPPRMGAPIGRQRWDGSTESVDGFCHLSNVEIDGVDIDLDDVRRLEIEGCRFANSVLRDACAELELEVSASEIEACDLSRRRLSVVRRSRFVGVKLTGADFAGGYLSDVEFVNCVLRLTSFRMAELKRVTFTDCQLDDVDAYSARLTDVAFPGSRLHALNLDKTTAERIDLRDAELDGLSGLGRLDGFLVNELQLPALAYQLAHAAGLSIEQA